MRASHPKTKNYQKKTPAKEIQSGLIKEKTRDSQNLTHKTARNTHKTDTPAFPRPQHIFLLTFSNKQRHTTKSDHHQTKQRSDNQRCLLHQILSSKSSTLPVSLKNSPKHPLCCCPMQPLHPIAIGIQFPSQFQEDQCRCHGPASTVVEYGSPRMLQNNTLWTKLKESTLNAGPE